MTTTEQSMLTRMIPLSLLKKSPRNVRQVSHTKEHIAALANSLAAHGQIQNLMVETEKGEDGTPTGYFLVNVGEGRRLASLLRVKRKQIKPEEPLRCVVDDAHDPQALSLAENDIRANMHPADQFEAFKRLVDGGISAEDVAAQFGVTPLVVTRRLKLANVAPEFLDLYRKAKLDLEQLMALALTDDHEKQRKVWEALPAFRRTADGLREALTENELPVEAALVKFVGLKQYEKAGGAVRRDLFSDENEGGYVLDTELLRKLAQQKLEKRAAKLKAEGWAWVEVMPELDYSALSAFGRVRPIRREATAQESAELERLNRELAEVERDIEATEGEGGQAESLQERQDEVGDKIEALEEALLVSDPEQKAVAGAIVSIDNRGNWRVETGLLRPEDARRFRETAHGNGDARSSEPRLHSAALVRRLTAHRTQALAAVLAQRPDVALLALAHRLAVVTFFGGGFDHRGAVQINLRRTDLPAFGDDIGDSKAHRAMGQLEEGWRSRIPSEAPALFGWLAEQPQADVLALCAFCVATTLDGVTADERRDVLNVLSTAARLDMHEWWSPTRESYLGSVPKARILEALKEAQVAPEAETLEKLKKGDLVTLAEQRLAGTGWLPPELRASNG